jgi:hypothetical protein
MPDVGRPKNNDYPPYMTVDGDRGGFIVRNPINKKKKRFPLDQEQLARDTAEALGELIEARRQNTLLNDGRPTVSMLTAAWQREQLPQMPWDESTRETAKIRLNRIDREMGPKFIDDLDGLYFYDWLKGTAPKADPFNKWRAILVLLWQYAVLQKWARANEPEKVAPRSTSRKIESNRKEREQLDVEGFLEIYAHAEPFCRLAMDASLLTLQARNEVCNFQHSHFRNGHLYVIRAKTAADSAMAFIRIVLTPELEELQARARQLDDIVCPYLVHRRPERMQRRWVEGKPHWAYVNEPYLTRAFADARDQVPRFAAMEERRRPPFHEIRGLGGRLCEERGMARKDIQALMTHSSPSTTAIYLEVGPQALTDEHFAKVRAPFTLRELLGR